MFTKMSAIDNKEKETLLIKITSNISDKPYIYIFFCYESNLFRNVFLFFFLLLYVVFIKELY